MSGLRAAPAPLTEEQIERRAEREMDQLDAACMGGAITSAEYEAQVLALDRWAEQQYGSLRQ